MSALSEFADSLSFGLVHIIRKKTHCLRDHVQTTDFNENTSNKLTGASKSSNTRKYILNKSHSTPSYPHSSVKHHSISLPTNKNSQIPLPIKRSLSTPPTTITTAYSFPTSPQNSNNKLRYVSLKRAASLPMGKTTSKQSKMTTSLAKELHGDTVLSCIPSESNLSFSLSHTDITNNSDTIIATSKVKQTRKVTIVDEPIDLVSGQTTPNYKLGHESVPSLILDDEDEDDNNDESVSLYSVNPEVKYKVVLADNIFPGYL